MPTGRPNNGGSMSSRNRCLHASRAAQALDLRLRGMNYVQIGEAMGVTRQRAYQLVTQELDRLNKLRAETAAELRRLELERYDRLLEAVWPRAMKGDSRAVGRALHISSRRCRLLGLDLVSPDVLDRDQAMQLVGVILGAIRSEVADPAVLARIRQRLAAHLGRVPEVPGLPAADGVVVTVDARAPPQPVPCDPFADHDHHGNGTAGMP
jgi:hypothetical protein